MKPHFDFTVLNNGRDGRNDFDNPMFETMREWRMCAVRISGLMLASRATWEYVVLGRKSLMWEYLSRYYTDWLAIQARVQATWERDQAWHAANIARWDEEKS